MRIQYMSDLHLEFQDNCRLVRDYDFPVTGDILVLAGDTMYLKDRTTAQMRFWKWASANFHDVLTLSSAPSGRMSLLRMSTSFSAGSMTFTRPATTGTA